MADPTESDETPDPPKKDWRKELEDRAKLAEEKAARAERELAFNKAGLTGLSDKQVKALMATHEGDISAESLRATATDLGFTKAEQEAAAEAATQPDATREAAELSNLTGSTVEVDERPVATTQEAFDKTVNEFERAEDLEEWARQNIHLFPYGQ